MREDLKLRTLLAMNDLVTAAVDRSVDDWFTDNVEPDAEVDFDEAERDFVANVLLEALKFCWASRTEERRPVQWPEDVAVFGEALLELTKTP